MPIIEIPKQYKLEGVASALKNQGFAKFSTTFH